MTKQLNEFITIPKGELKQVDIYSGKPFYTSIVLKENYLKAMEKSGRAAPVIKKITKLVEESVIIPVYKSKSILKSILKLQPVQFSGILGAAIPDKKLIYVFVESSANIFSFSKNSAMAKVTVHELLHLLSFTKPKVFYTIFNNELKAFYNSYFCSLLSCNETKIDNNKIKKLVDFIFWKSEQNKRYLSEKQLEQYHNLIVDGYKEHSTLNEKMFEKKIKDYIVVLKTIQRLEAYGRGHQIIYVATAFKHIIAPFYKTYKKVFSINPLKENQFVYQEMFAPSEIISTQSIAKTPSPIIYKAINRL